jgi:dihydroneopterin aldolase
MSVARVQERPLSDPDPGPGAPVMIYIRELFVDTIIGVYEHERSEPRTLLMDLDIELFASRAGRTDHLGDTVDYAAVVDLIRMHLAENRYYLLERAAEVIAERILEEFGARRVRVNISKVGILERVGRVGVEICRTQSREAAADRQPVVALHSSLARGDR